MAKYLVTGASGFIGSALAMHLAELGHTVIGFDTLEQPKRLQAQRGIIAVQGDINDQKAIRSVMEMVDGCFHLAAFSSSYQSTLDWLGTHKTNAVGTISVLSAAYHVRPSTPIPVIYMSSSAVYGSNSGNHPLSEDILLAPSTPYAADKAACEYYGSVASQLYQVPCMGFRLFNAYSGDADPNSPYSGVIIRFLNAVLQNKPLEVHGDGLQTRDFVYINDVVNALLMGMQQIDLQHRVYNICTGIPCSLLQLLEILKKVSRKTIKVEFASKRSIDIRYCQGNPEKARKELGFVAQASLEDGLSEAYHLLKVKAET